MPQCLVKTCGNYHGKTKSGNTKVIYHMLPSSVELQSKWIEMCKCEENSKIAAYSRVCSDHFTSDCYQRDLQHELLGLPLRKKLKSDAIPNRNLPHQLETKENHHENKSPNNFRLLLPMRSSVRIAKNESGRLSQFNEKGAQLSENKLKFMKNLRLKYKNRWKLPLDDRGQRMNRLSLSKMQIMEEVREGCGIQPSSPGHAEEPQQNEDEVVKGEESEDNGFAADEPDEDDEVLVNGTSSTIKEESLIPDDEHKEEIVENDEANSVKVETVSDNNHNEESSNSSEEASSSATTTTTATKRKADEGAETSTKRLRLDIQENFFSRDKILNEFIELADCSNVDQLQNQTEQILAEIRTLNDLAKEKEREWNNIIHLKKMKEELLLRMQRRKQVILLTSDKNDNGESQDCRNQSILKTNHNKSLKSSGNKQKSIQPKQQQYDMNGSLSDFNKQNKQRPILDVQSIIADYRQRHPEAVPRRGRRIRGVLNNCDDNQRQRTSVLNFSSLALGSGSQVHQNYDVNSDLGLILNALDSTRPSSGESPAIGDPSFKDLVVGWLAKLSQNEQNELIQNAMKPPPPYPEVTVHPVPTATTPAPTNSLLHGILTKNVSKSKSKTSFSPTLAKLLTAPERGNGQAINNPAAANNIAQAANMSISEILSTSKARNEITITPVGGQFDGTVKNKNLAHVAVEEDEAEDGADRLVIDESNEDSKVRGDNGSDAGDEVPQCQGCNQKSALFVCAGCGNQWYCSRECQVSAWDEHSEVCSG